MESDDEQPKGLTNTSQSVIEGLKSTLAQQFEDRDKARTAQVELLKKARVKNIEDAIGIDWTGMFFSYLEMTKWIEKPNLDERIKIIESYRSYTPEELEAAAPEDPLGHIHFKKLEKELGKTTDEGEGEQKRAIFTSDQKKKVFERLDTLKKKMIDVLEKQKASNAVSVAEGERLVNAEKTKVTEQAGAVQAKIMELEDELEKLAQIYLSLAGRLEVISNKEIGKEITAYTPDLKHKQLVSNIQGLKSFEIKDDGTIMPRSTLVNEMYLDKRDLSKWNKDEINKVFKNAQQEIEFRGWTSMGIATNLKINNWNKLKNERVKVDEANRELLKIYNWLAYANEQVERKMGEAPGTGSLAKGTGPVTQTEPLGRGAVESLLEERLQQARGNRSEVPPRTLSAFQSLVAPRDRAAEARERMAIREESENNETYKKNKIEKERVINNILKWFASEAPAARNSATTVITKAIEENNDPLYIYDEENKDESREFVFTTIGKIIMLMNSVGSVDGEGALKRALTSLASRNTMVKEGLDDLGIELDNSDHITKLFNAITGTPISIGGGKKTQRKRRHKKSKTLKAIIKKKPQNPKKQKKPKRRLVKRKSKRTFRKRRNIKQKTMKA